ncbi:MAG TPA: nucleotidyltransferase family protein [Pyrinomonadaceae bacterium]
MSPAVDTPHARQRKSTPSIIAELLKGSWRPSPPVLNLNEEELARVVPQLKGSGTAALAWWRMRGSRLRDTAAGEELRRAYQTQTLQSALQEREVGHVCARLRAAGVEPILLKGLGAARLYAERGLRPAGDIDLCVRPEQYEDARRAVWGPGAKGGAPVDLKHDDSALLTRDGWDGLYARSVLLDLDGTRVRVPGGEDHLRFLCLHLLRHSAYRPLWLCDVAAALESAPEEFDWDVAVGCDALRRNWVGCVLDLARRLLGATREALPEFVCGTRAPAWLLTEVLRQWERPTTADHEPRELMAVSLRNPLRALPALVGRWPDPVRALVGLNLPFDERARLPRQLKFYVVQSAAFLKRPLRPLKKED